jgi:hypothetical protein
VVVQLAEVRGKKKRRSLAELRTRREARVTEWRRALASGEVGSRAALARREGVSRAWVTKAGLACAELAVALARAVLSGTRAVCARAGYGAGRDGYFAISPRNRPCAGNEVQRIEGKNSFRLNRYW